jgi:hypothetical protein
MASPINELASDIVNKGIQVKVNLMSRFNTIEIEY